MQVSKYPSIQVSQVCNIPTTTKTYKQTNKQTAKQYKQTEEEEKNRKILKLYERKKTNKQTNKNI